MLRNIVVTAVVSLIMASFALIYSFLAPTPVPPAMSSGGQPSAAQTGGMEGQGQQAPSQPSMGGQASGTQAGQMGGEQPAQGGGMGGGMMGMCGGMMGKMGMGGMAMGKSGMQKGMSMGGGMGMMCPMMGMMAMGSMNPSGGMKEQGKAGQTTQPSTRPQEMAKPLTKDQAKERVENYLKALGNPNLHAGNIKETDGAYEVDVVTKDGSLVNRVIVNKKTGQMKTQY